MEVKQITAILCIAEEGSISKAAERLFITQSALNQQLLKLERELGVDLFQRLGRGVSPTYAGGVYIEAAREMLEIRNETYKMLGDIANVKKGEIAIAYTPERGSQKFLGVYPQFHEKYPEITFKIFEARGKRMEQLLERRQVSIALTSYSKPNPLFHYLDVQEEYIVLGVPRNHPLAHLAGEESWNTLPKVDLKLFEHDHFVLTTYESVMRPMCDDAFEAAGFSPKILFESTSTFTAVNMVRNQVALAFFPQSYVDAEAPVAYFSVATLSKWYLTVATYKGAYLNRAERDFIDMYIQIEYEDQIARGERQREE